MKSGIPRADTESQIQAQRIAHLYSQAPVGFTFTIFNGSILAYLLRPQVSESALWIWFVSLVVVTLFRGLLAFLFHRANPKQSRIHRWETAYLVGTAAAGICWGGTAVFLFPEGDIGYQMFIVFVLAGMAAGAVSVLSASLTAFLLFIGPVLLPLATRLFMQGDLVSRCMAGMTLLYCVGMFVAARGVNRTISTCLRMRFDNRELSREIDYRQKTEEALFRQKERLQTTLSSLAEGVVITSADASIEYLNPAAETISGWSNETAKGRAIGAIFSNAGADGSLDTVTAAEECLINGTRSKTNTLVLNRLGEELFIEEVAAPLRDRNGRIEGAVAVLRNVTQAHRHSLQLAHDAERAEGSRLTFQHYSAGAMLISIS